MTHSKHKSSETANAFKMVVARTLQQKQILEELGESTEDFEIETANAEAALNDIGVTIRGTGGELRDIESILGDVASKWNDLSDSSQQFLAEKLAGNNRRSYFVTAMEEYARVLELQEAGFESAGALAEANEVRVQSLAGQINILKDKFMSLSDGMDSGLYTLVSFGNGLLDIVNWIGTFPSAVGLASASFLTFNDNGKQLTQTLSLLSEKVPVIGDLTSKMNILSAKYKEQIDIQKEVANQQKATIKQYLEKIATVQKSTQTDELKRVKVGELIGKLREEQIALKATQKELMITTAKSVALQTVMTVGLSAGITLVISLFGKLKNKLEEVAHETSVEGLTESINDLTQKTNEFAENMSKFEQLKVDTQSIRELQEEIDNANLSSEEMKEKQDKINELLSNHASSYESIEGVINSELVPLERKLELLEQMAELEAKQQAQDLKEQAEKKNGLLGWLGIGENDFELVMSKTDELTTEFALAMGKIRLMMDNGQEGTKEFIQQQEKVETKISEIQQQAKLASEEMANYLTMYENGVIDDEYFNQVFDQYKENLEELKTMFSDFGLEVPLIDFSEQLIEGLEEQKGKVAEAVQTINLELNKVGKIDTGSKDGATAFNNSINTIKSSLTSLESDSDKAKVVLKKLQDTFSDMPKDIDNVSEAIDFLNGKLQSIEPETPMRKIQEEYVEASNALEELGELIAIVNEGLEDTENLNKVFNSDLMADYVGSYDDLIAIQDHLGSKAEEMKNAYAEAYTEMNRHSTDFWNNQIKGSQEWIDFEKQAQNDLTAHFADCLGVELNDFSNFIAEKGGLRDIDLSNAENLADAEDIVNADLMNQLIGYYGQYCDEKGIARNTDLANVVQLLNEQGGVEIKTINQLIEAWEQYYIKKKNEIKSALADLSSAMSTELTNLQNSGAQVYDKYDMGNYSASVNETFGTVSQTIKQLNSMADTVGGFLNGARATFGGVSAGLDQAQAKLKKVISKNSPSSSSSSKSSGSSGSGSKGSSGSSSSSKETQNEVADLELKIDKYQELEEAITRVTEALERNSYKQQMVSTKAELKTLLDEEIKLMEKKKSAIGDLQKELQKEQQALKTKLEKSGLKFDGDELVGDKQHGTIAKRLEDAVKWANSATGAEKERRIADTEYLAEMIDTYYDLMNQLGSTTNEYNEMTLAIRQAKKEHQELLKAVENLADRYLKFEMRANALNNELSLNQRKQEYAVGKDLLALRERELEIIKQQQVVSDEKLADLNKEKEELINYLKGTGFTIGADGTITNYDKKWQDKTDKYNTLAGVEAEEYKEYLDEVAEKIERYLEIVQTEIPECEEAYYDMLDAVKELEKQQKAYAEQLEEVLKMYDRLFEVTQKLTKATNELSVIEARLNLASGEEKIDLLLRQVELYEAQTKLLLEQRKIQEENVAYLSTALENKGFEFDKNGYITNYNEVIGKMAKEIEKMVGGTIRDEAIEEYEDLIAKVEEYNSALQEVQDTEQEWWNLQNTIKDAQRSQLEIVQDVQKSIAEAIQNRWQQSTDTIKKELEKQKELMNKQWEEEDWEDQLAESQDSLNKLQAQIDNLSKDTSLAGQLKLEQLKEEYAEQLKEFNDMIKDHERELANEMFEEEANRLDEEMENGLDTETLANMVNDALKTGIVQIGDETIRLNDLMIDNIMQQEEAYYALGEVMKSEMLDNLETAVGLWKDIEKLSNQVNSSIVNPFDSNSLNNITGRSNQTSILENNMSPLITVNIDGDSGLSLYDVENMVEEQCNMLIVKINELMQG